MAFRMWDTNRLVEELKKLQHLSSGPVQKTVALWIEEGESDEAHTHTNQLTKHDRHQRIFIS